ncbi:DUF3108 domain-containing protein [Flavobacterium sp. JP2137]|uniref:DUF3108 domain-containing protein n=1 Tax=Flavobacterium sp. JP2137 TaxID=3414510 RepID=UPI003D2FEA66
MKKITPLLLLILLFSGSTFAQQNKAFAAGEFFKFKITYGIVNAGIATMELKEVQYDGKKVLHAKGHGYTTGVTKFFFKVNDDYQSYFNKNTNVPYRFIRKINEGGYTKNQEGFFNHDNATVLVKDYEKMEEKTYSITDNVQDIVSSFYYLRNHPKINSLKQGEDLEIDMFFDGEVFKFKLKYQGKENIRTKFGTIESMKFTPYVQAGRVFKAQESLTVWVSADENKVPLRIKATLLVGSLSADLDAYRGLKYKLKIK